MSRRSLVVVLVLVALVGACRDDPGDEPRAGPTTPTPDAEGVDRPPHVIAVLEADGRFGILLRMLRRDAPGSFLQAMQGPDWDMTLFAPTDEAFEALGPERIEEIRGDAAGVTQLLEGHIVGRIVTGEQLVALEEVETLAGPVAIGRDGAKLTFGGVTLTEPDIPASNGVIHAVDAVTLP